MSLTTTSQPAAVDITRARCHYMKSLLEPWSIRRLSARTGLTKSAVESLYAGTRDISMADLEVLAPVIRMKPVDLFAELLAVGTTKGPHPVEGEGRSLPGLDSNQEPAGFKPSNVIEADFGRPQRDVTPRPLATIGGTR